MIGRTRTLRLLGPANLHRLDIMANLATSHVLLVMNHASLKAACIRSNFAARLRELAIDSLPLQQACKFQ